MMAVITKAMGAFLILMIMLLPYYTGDTQGQQTVDETRQRIDDAKAGLDKAVDRLKKGRLSDPEIDELLKSLTQARDELTEAQSLIAQLRIKVDQAASQINRLEQLNAMLDAQVADQRGQIAALDGKVVALTSAIGRLQSEIEAAMQARGQLEQQNLALAAQVSNLQKKEAYQEQKIADLEDEIARLKAIDTSALQAKIKELQELVEDVVAANASLKAIAERLTAQSTAMVAENKRLRLAANESQVLFALARCDRPADMQIDLREARLGREGSQTLTEMVRNILPWQPRRVSRPRPGFDDVSQSLFSGDDSNTTLAAIKYDFSDKPLSQDTFFITLKISDGLYRNIEADSDKDAGGIKDSAGQPTCSVAFFSSTQGNIAKIGTYRLGAAEPVVFTRRATFDQNGSLTYNPDQHPGIHHVIADAMCEHRPPFCRLAKRHADWRAAGRDPWSRENQDPTAKPPGPPPPPTQDRAISTRPGVSPPPLSERTVGPR